MIIEEHRKAPARSPSQATSSARSPRTTIAGIRRQVVEAMRGDLGTSAAPIRLMARLVGAVEAECRTRGLPASLIRQEVVNRTIGDVNPRLIVERDARYDYRTIADDLGVALPGEKIGGLKASGERYLALRARMIEMERRLLTRGYDPHVYDLPGVGNPLLREWIAADQQAWGLPMTADQVLLSAGSLDGLDKAMRGLRASRWAGPAESVALLFPTPSFGVPEWQAKSLGIRVIRVRTTPEACYKLTAEQLRATLAEHPAVRGIYLILSNNPTAYSYSPAELRELLAVVREHPDVIVLADMAYTGTGDLADERARVAAFVAAGVVPQTIFCWSLSKVYTMTGDRFGYLCVGDPDLAPEIGVVWINTIASLPAEWQLRYLAFYELLRDHPEIREKIGALYALRRRALARQLEAIDRRLHVFAQINLDDGGTIYNWSRLAPEVNVFDLFAETGIAGVPGSAFGYSDDHMRFSVGMLPVPGWQFIARGVQA
jgi:aspartate/methionine/tyrosine aminotransferase